MRFDYSTHDFNTANALCLAEASMLAYKSEDEIKKCVEEEWKFDRFQFFDQGETQAFLCGNKNMLILAFRGTEKAKIQDCITDANCALIDDKYGKIHMGFAAALKFVWDEIVDAMRKFRDNAQPLWITGHSLGGALATLATAWCIQNKIKVDGLYTFGQPRVGDKTFAEKFDSIFKARTFRFVNNEDIVACIPWVAGYEHIGKIMYFNNMGELVREPGLIGRVIDQFIAKFMRQIDKGGLLKEIFPNEIEDHSLDRYIERIKKNM